MENPDDDIQASVTWDSCTTWHLYWRACAGRSLLADELLAARIRSRLLRAHEQPGRQLLSFVVLPVEIHVLTQLSIERDPSQLIREIASVVARWVREHDGAAGPVFAERYQAHQVQDLPELKQELRMLAWRPVLTGQCQRPSHYSHASLRVALGLQRARGFDARALLACFGAPVPVARLGLRRCIASRPSASEADAWELVHGLRTAAPRGLQRGGRSIKGLVAVLVAASDTQDVAGALELLRRWVVHQLRLSEPRLKDEVRVRALVARLARQLKLCSSAAVARHFGRSKGTLCAQMAMSERDHTHQWVLRTPVSRLVEEAVALAGRTSREPGP